MDLDIINSRIKIIVRPNSGKNEIIGYDPDKQAYRVSIKAPPEDGKANLEVVKFFSKLLKRDVKIVSGIVSKHKVLKIS